MVAHFSPERHQSRSPYPEGSCGTVAACCPCWVAVASWAVVEEVAAEVELEVALSAAVEVEDDPSAAVVDPAVAVASEDVEVASADVASAASTALLVVLEKVAADEADLCRRARF